MACKIHPDVTDGVCPKCIENAIKERHSLSRRKTDKSTFKWQCISMEADDKWCKSNSAPGIYQVACYLTMVDTSTLETAKVFTADELGTGLLSNVNTVLDAKDRLSGINIVDTNYKKLNVGIDIKKLLLEAKELILVLQSDSRTSTFDEDIRDFITTVDKLTRS